MSQVRDVILRADELHEASARYLGCTLRSGKLEFEHVLPGPHPEAQLAEHPCLARCTWLLGRHLSTQGPAMWAQRQSGPPQQALPGGGALPPRTWLGGAPGERQLSEPAAWIRPSSTPLLSPVPCQREYYTQALQSPCELMTGMDPTHAPLPRAAAKWIAWLATEVQAWALYSASKRIAK